MISRRTAAWMGDDVWGAEEHLEALWHAAIVVETPALARKAGAAALLRVRNTSAIPMRIAVRSAPSWLVLIPPLQFDAESLTVIRPGFNAPPAGEHRIELELEVQNMHVAPGRNLTVKVPLTVTVG